MIKFYSMCACVRAHVRVCVPACVRAWSLTCVRAWAHACIHACMHACMGARNGRFGLPRSHRALEMAAQEPPGAVQATWVLEMPPRAPLRGTGCSKLPLGCHFRATGYHRVLEITEQDRETSRKLERTRDNLRKLGKTTR